MEFMNALYKDKAYHEGLQYIAQARRSSSASLDMSGIGLHEVPISIIDLQALTSLNLGNNLLTTLPEQLGKLPKLQVLNLFNNQFRELPTVLPSIRQLKSLSIGNNQFTSVPEVLRQLSGLTELGIGHNPIQTMPAWLGQMRHLQFIDLSGLRLEQVPTWVEQLTELRELVLDENQITELPVFLSKLDRLEKIRLQGNPLVPEVSAAYGQGMVAVKAYLRAKANSVPLNEAKLIIIGEGEVGKSCLLGALRNDPWEEGRPTTHGIEIKPITLKDQVTNKEIILNGWDFGGQRVYRPTHQLFFSAPAVYLVVWKPREGPQQGFVKEWIRLVKHREPTARIIVVATHGGPQQRQPDIDRQELWDLFSRETIVDFFFVDSKPDEHGRRKGIEELKHAISRAAVQLPEVGRFVPKSFADVRAALRAHNAPYLALDEVLATCKTYEMDDDVAELFISISHRLGHITHYQHDPALRDIVILRPDWLATAMSYVLDDEVTRNNHGLVAFDRLEYLWNDARREVENRYPPELHPLFLRLMERFDLSYKVVLPSEAQDAISFWQQFRGLFGKANKGKDLHSDLHYTSLIGQLVPDNRSENFSRAWAAIPAPGDLEQSQVCHIVDDQGNTATAEGLFYQLIVRLHRYSLGHAAYKDSVHWQRGLVLDDDYNGRALLEQKGNDVHITVRAPYPERFLTMLTEEVKYLVESFWEGLRCDVMVPCLSLEPCIGLFEVRKLIENKKRGRPEQPCPVCNEWQNIDRLLVNAPEARNDGNALLFREFEDVKAEIEKARLQLSEKMSYQSDKFMGRFDRLDDRTRRLMSRVDKAYNDFIQIFTDEAKDGPRLFSLVPVNRSGFNPNEWTSAKFRLILWCEHSRLPLPILNGRASQAGIYEFEFTREWFTKAAPVLKLMTNTLSLVLPVAASGAKLMIETKLYNSLQDYFNFGRDVIDASLGAGEKVGVWENTSSRSELPRGSAIRAEDATLRELHRLLKSKDPGLGGLVRVLNKRNEFLWVHEKFASEY